LRYIFSYFAAQNKFVESFRVEVLVVEEEFRLLASQGHPYRGERRRLRKRKKCSGTRCSAFNLNLSSNH